MTCPSGWTLLSRIPIFESTFRLPESETIVEVGREVPSHTQECNKSSETLHKTLPALNGLDGVIPGNCCRFPNAKEAKIATRSVLCADFALFSEFGCVLTFILDVGALFD